MDLSNIEELLDTFSTFAGNIVEFLTLPVTILNDVLGADLEDESATTSSALENLSS